MKRLALSLIVSIALAGSACAHKQKPFAVGGDLGKITAGTLDAGAISNASSATRELAMQMPADVYATMAAVVEKFPHTGTDDERRVAMEKAVATLRARFGPRWVWKTEHETMVQPVGQFQFSGSKDGLAYVPEGDVVHGRLTTMFIWDTISGTSRRLYAAPLVSEPARQAYVLAVEPKDWLAGDNSQLPTPNPQPPATPPSNTAPADPPEWLLQLLAAWADAENLLRAKLAALEAKLDALAAKPLPVYTGSIRVFGTSVPITLEPRK